MARKLIFALPIAVLIAAGGFAIYRYTASGQPAYALRVNGQTFSPGDVATRVAIAQGVGAATRRHSPGATIIGDSSEGAVVQQMIKEALELQEARRRGITCTQVEADGQEATAVAEGVANGGTNNVLALAAGLGIVPLNYLDTPVAQRTPDAKAVIAAYLSDPRITGGGVRDCIIGKLFAQVRQQSGNNGPKGDQAITGLQARLRAAARIDGPALTPQPAVTPTP